MRAFIVFLLLLAVVPLSEAVGEFERFILQNPLLLRQALIGIVLLMGIAIIVIRAFFNKGTVKRSVRGLSGEEESQGAGGGAFNLKPAKLVEMHRNQAYKIPANGALTLGRVFDNMVVLKNPSVSRHHAKIVPEREGYAIYDLGSKKGTFVNGEMIDRKLLRNSDMIEIAREDFMFIYE
jgi:hypothetical protein